MTPSHTPPTSTPTSPTDMPMNERQVATWLLTVLQAILNEQEKARIIDHDTSRYIYAAVRDQALRQGWIE